MNIPAFFVAKTADYKGKRKQLTKVKASEKITLLNINCRSIKNKIPDLHQVIQQVKPDIISCTETWLKPEVHYIKLSSTRQVTRATHVRNRICPRVKLIIKIILILLIIFLGFIKSKSC